MKPRTISDNISCYIGRKIWIISCPRKPDNADAFANMEATIDEVFEDGGLALLLKSGGDLVIAACHVPDLQFILF